jgi:putative transposase
MRSACVTICPCKGRFLPIGLRARGRPPDGDARRRNKPHRRCAQSGNPGLGREQEYHRTRHWEIDATPLAHYLAGPNVARPCPAAAVLADSFRIEVVRRQRRSDGTVSLHGARFEIPSRYRHFERVDLVDARTGAILCPVKPLDKSANANGCRRRLSPVTTDLSPLQPKGLPALMTELLADYAATGVPPAYLPSHCESDA